MEGLAAGGACGFKVHEDLGAHPRCLDTALTVADAYDVQVALHTDGLNEAGCVADTLAVAGGRTFHAFHGLDPERDSALARDRIRAGTMAAEGPLHDLGVIPITSSDAQGMGRAGETVRRTFGLASVMKRAAGSPGPDDNERVLRYLAKLTINPAVAHEVGSVEVGKLADIVLWDPAWFGAKPTLVLKAGVPAWGRPATRTRRSTSPSRSYSARSPVRAAPPAAPPSTTTCCSSKRPSPSPCPASTSCDRKPLRESCHGHF